MFNSSFKSSLFESDLDKPLAARVRPKKLDEYVGQKHILSPDMPLYKSIKQGLVHSMLLWGPPGSGKTTLAEVIANNTKASFVKLSAIDSTVKDIRQSVDEARARLATGVKTVVFVDEVHRFNKAQQDVFLPYIENGIIYFIGATTENPSFALNNALLSRLKVYLLQSLSREDIVHLLQNTLASPRGLNNQYEADEEDLKLIATNSDGDARFALNLLEQWVDYVNCENATNKNIQNTASDFIEKSENVVKLNSLSTVLTKKPKIFDKSGDEHYEILSAFHKSVRGSDPNAALYWLAKFINSGGDGLVIGRRMLAIASEDIGLADLNALNLANNAFDAYHKLGLAEGGRALAQAAVYLALAPKSNALYKAYNSAMLQVQNDNYKVPPHLCNATTNLLKNIGKGKGYRYAHDEPNAFSPGQSYLPNELLGHEFYHPSERGLEQKLKQKYEWLKEQNNQYFKRKK